MSPLSEYRRDPGFHGQSCQEGEEWAGTTCSQAMPTCTRELAQDIQDSEGRERAVVAPAKGRFHPEKSLVGGKAVGKPQQLSGPLPTARGGDTLLEAVCTEGWRQHSCRHSTGRCGCKLLSEDTGARFSAELPAGTAPVVAALFLLPASPSFCPSRTTAASLSRGTWLRISRRSLGTCS